MSGKSLHLYSLRFGDRLGCHAVWQDTSDQLCVAIFLVSDDLPVLEVDHKDVVVVVAPTVAGQIFTSGLQNDDVATIDQPRGDGGSFNENTIQWAEDLFDDGLLARELATPRAFTYGAPDHVIAACLPKRRAIAFGDFVEDGRDDLGVGRKTAHMAPGL